MEPDGTSIMYVVSETGNSPRPAASDARENRRRILADSRQIRELSRLLCAIAREQREFCIAQRMASPRSRVEAIRERRERLYGTEASALAE